MKQRPILFSTPMVQAVLDKTKSQTRRLKGLDDINKNPDDYVFNGFGHTQKGVFGALFMHKSGLINLIPCPFGIVGDVLWVRETWNKVIIWGVDDEPHADIQPEFIFKASEGDVIEDNEGNIIKWKPSIHMPKKACRIWLQITDIRVERLQSISEDDAKNEGVEGWIEERLKSKPTHYKVYYHDDDDDSTYSSSAITSFETLWQKINGKNAWNANPWVWVIEFKQIQKP